MLKATTPLNVGGSFNWCSQRTVCWCLYRWSSLTEMHEVWLLSHMMALMKCFKSLCRSTTCRFCRRNEGYTAWVTLKSSIFSRPCTNGWRWLGISQLNFEWRREYGQENVDNFYAFVADLKSLDDPLLRHGSLYFNIAAYLQNTDPSHQSWKTPTTPLSSK